MRLHRLVALGAIACAVACPRAVADRATGRTLYVSSSAGSDAGAGTSAAPFQTLQRAADAVTADANAHAGVAAGGTVIVRAGTYPAGFILGWDTPAAGTAAAPIVFQADPNAPAASVIIT